MMPDLELNILNLGAGVQSTTLYLLAVEGKLRFDYAIFADTQGEPKKVYKHLEWLRKQPGPPILTGTAGNLRDDLLNGINSRGDQKYNGRFASIPAFTAKDHTDRPADYDPKKEAGRVQRQCTRDYKTDVVQRVIRRELLKLKPRQRVPKHVRVIQSIGISLDERGRAARIMARFKENIKWSTPVFPLIEMGWTRRGCMRWLERRVPHPVPKSACVFCPYTDDLRWAEMKRDEPEEFAEACAVDKAIRLEGSRAASNLQDKLYLHRQCIPLEMVDLSNPKAAELDNFSLFDCLGMCGN